MTRHNLEDQLRWLMHANPSRPAEVPWPQATWSFDAITEPVVAPECNVPDEFDDDLDDTSLMMTHSSTADGLPRRPEPDARTTLHGHARKRTMSSAADSDIELLNIAPLRNDSSTGVSSKPSRKRKSDDLHLDQPGRPAKQRSYTYEPSVPNEPPPPYSTHLTPPQNALQTGQTTPKVPYSGLAASNALDDDDDDLFDFNGSRARNVTVQRRSPVRRSPQGWRRDHDKQSTVSHLLQKQDALCITETPRKDCGSVPASRGRDSTTNVQTDAVASKKPAPVNALTHGLAREIQQATVQPTTIGRPTRFQTPTATPSGRSGAKHDMTELEAFLKLDENVIRDVLKTIESKQHEISYEIATLLEQDEFDALPELYEVLDTLRNAAIALPALQQCEQTLARLGQSRKDCLEALADHVRQHGASGIDNLKAASTAAKEELEVCQAECLSLLAACQPYLTGVQQGEQLARRKSLLQQVEPSSKRSPQPARTAQLSPIKSRTEHATLQQHDFEIFDDDVDILDMAEAEEIKWTSATTPKRKPFDEVSGNARPSAHKSGKQRQSLAGNENSQVAELFRYSWSDDVKQVLRERFGLQGFRHKQLDAINATLAGEDTFVLMPTGGGKSLCYQLPSQIRTGKTQGVTIVVSPLLSLMEDQVHHMRELGIQAVLINGSTSQADRSHILNHLRAPSVQTVIQILYITPEMLSKSSQMVNAIDQLHRNRRFARLVIDEAHCVSQWGHDFRPDYKLLGDFRRKFPSVPVMALTATATENVKADTIHNLGIERCKVMTRSFNRPNLYYEVRAKGSAKADQASIAELINTAHKGQTGIIYCLSRKNCETMADILRGYRIKAEAYHAGMDVKKKTAIQQGWQAGRYHVIVATIAFGMGIDKANVRFVIHNSLPKSLEGYYQETGRAGRDGEPSRCYLFFGFGDVSKLRRMIEASEDASFEQKQRQHEMLRRMVSFCTNKTDCRRVQILSYFSELFKKDDCHQSCDNCCSDSTFEKRDVTEYANQVVELVRQVQDCNVTMLYCIDVFTGASKKAIRDNQHENLRQFGIGMELERDDVERLFVSLIAQGALIERQVMNKAGFPVQYAMVNTGQQRISRFEMSMRLSPIAKKKQRTELPLSTNVSSPIHTQPKSRSRPVKQRKDIASYALDAESDDADESFEPGPAAKGRAPRPISADDTLDHLDGWHQVAVEDYLVLAKELANKLTAQHGLRIVLFSDTMLRQMAVGFTTDLSEMKKIPHINKAHVDKYGARFVKLLKQTQQEYEQRVKQAPIDNPNAVVIEVSSDEESSDEDAYGTMDEGDFDMDDGTQAELDAFNNQFAESQSAAMRQKTVVNKTRRKQYKPRAAGSKPSRKPRKRSLPPKMGNQRGHSASLIGMMPT